MKKKIALMMAVILACCMFVLAGCNNSPAASTSVEDTTWALSGGSQNGQSVTREQLESLFGEMTYTFSKDGKVTMNMGGQSLEATWKQSGDKVTISSNGQDSTLTVNGDKMNMEQNGTTIEFTKK